LAVASYAVSDEDTSREVFRGLDALVVDLEVGTVELVASRDEHDDRDHRSALGPPGARTASCDGTATACRCPRTAPSG
jgi:hypothetical protein